MQCIEAVFMGLEAALEAPNTHVVDALMAASCTVPCEGKEKKFTRSRCILGGVRASTSGYVKYDPSNRTRPPAVTRHASIFTSCIRTSHTRFLNLYKDMQTK